MLLRKIFVALVCCGLSSVTSLAQPPMVEKYLLGGNADAGATALTEHLSNAPADSQAQLGLGVARFVIAVEHLGQNFYSYGLRDLDGTFGAMIPLLRLPIPFNKEPKTLSYEDTRRILQEFIDDLAIAEKALSEVDDPSVQLPLHVTKIAMNFAKKNADPVPLKEILVRMRAIRGERELFVVFDQADVTWLRGYCHLLSAMCEFALAYDGQEIFNATAHLFFQRVESPFFFLQKGRTVYSYGGSFDIADVIAFIHLIRMPVKEPQRMKRSLEHLERVLELSDEMWKQVATETDDDHEWIPNPRQTGELGLRVNQEMIDGWLLATEEGLEILRGKRLIPFWRGNGDMGVNLHRVFTEPTPFDLVLWIQGTAAAPYLEKGNITRPEVWSRLQQVFRGNFVVFALWFN